MSIYIKPYKATIKLDSIFQRYATNREEIQPLDRIFNQAELPVNVLGQENEKPAPSNIQMDNFQPPEKVTIVYLRIRLSF